MSKDKIKVVTLLETDAKKRGHEHGETLRQEIKELAEIRIERMCNTSHFNTEKKVLDLAHEHVPLLKQFDEDLYQELLGISEGSNVSMAKLIVINNFTDMRDIKPHGFMDPDGCSIIYSPAPGGPILGQTWDIHGNAQPYVIVIKLIDQVIFSIAGCLGVTGINKYGVAIAINNLASIDARVGVIWPAIVRKALMEKNALDAKDQIMKARNGSGRHYAVADMDSFFSIETSATKRKVIKENTHEVYFHTNHCLNKEMRKTHIILKQSTTFVRFKQLDEVVRHISLDTMDQVFLALKEVGLPSNEEHIQQTATCGTVVMNIKDHSMLACPGIANEENLLCNNIISC